MQSKIQPEMSRHGTPANSTLYVKHMPREVPLAELELLFGKDRRFVLLGMHDLVLGCHHAWRTGSAVLYVCARLGARWLSLTTRMSTRRVGTYDTCGEQRSTQYAACRALERLDG